jgi:putative redox protein
VERRQSLTGPTAAVSVRWREKLVFEGGGSGRPAVTVDGDSKIATSPVELLLVAAAACTATDVVDMLQKMRVDLRTLQIEVLGARRDEHPRRFTALQFHFRVSGTGADETKVRRAVDLSFEKYCSVMNSLAPDIQVGYDVALE